MVSRFMIQTEMMLALYRACDLALAAKAYAEDVALRGGPAEMIEASSWWAAESLQRVRVAVRSYDALGHAPAGWH
jgi:hypothetical protein